MSLGAGIHDVPAEVYHADCAPEPSLSNSLLSTLILKTPRHARLKHPRLNPDYVAEESTKFDIGSACHSLLLEGADRVCVIPADDWKTQDARDERDSARAMGLIPLLTDQYRAALDMRDEALAFIESTSLRGIFAASKPEQTLIWQDRKTWCRARLDLLTDDRSLILDYKSTAADSPGLWMRRYIVEHGYDTQDVWYRRGLAALGFPRAEFQFLVQETRAPYLCYLVDPIESMRELGGLKVERGLQLWRDCLASNSWPGYPVGAFQAEAPSWALEQEGLQS